MRTFPLGFGDSLVTKWNKGMWNERVVKTKTIWSWRNWSKVSKKTSQEHSIWHGGGALNGNVGHPFGYVVSQVEGLAHRHRGEHIAKAKIDMIPIPCSANDIGSNDFLGSSHFLN